VVRLEPGHASRGRTLKKRKEEFVYVLDGEVDAWIKAAPPDESR